VALSSAEASQPAQAQPAAPLPSIPVPPAAFSSDHWTVTIPEELEAIAPRYLSARRKELPEMVALLAASDFEQISSRGHNMKGTGRSYGFPDLSEIGAALERSAKQQDKEAIDKQLLRLANYLESVQISEQPAETR
jgi:histidine phosphotransfer protein HptB